MNRPRNRQPRPPRNETGNGRGHGAGSGRPARSNQAKPSYPSSVPNIHQVIPGAQVSIVLKQDQPTGHEVQGIVADVLTRGNHPRGIKVRLQDGRVGRVQRMNNGSQTAQVQMPDGTFDGSSRLDHGGEPPARTLADYIPTLGDDSVSARHRAPEPSRVSTATAICPICEAFEGDEIAVSHHVQTHLE
jgi:uncharacterized repeat protein (TIGR03833 family)